MKLSRTSLAGGTILTLLGLCCLVLLVVPALEARGGEGGSYAYEGSKSCKKCHSATYKSWENLKHGQALETLKPGQAVEAKTKHNLDPTKDYTQDESCLKCHTTGWGHEGGYFIPDPNDKKAVRKADKLAGVGCEACHGPGEKYGEIFKEIMTSKRTYKVEELTAVGLVVPNEQTCVTCHNSDSPTHNPAEKFDFEKMKEKGVHEHVELKQREG